MVYDNDVDKLRVSTVTIPPQLAIIMFESKGQRTTKASIVKYISYPPLPLPRNHLGFLFVCLFVFVKGDTKRFRPRPSPSHEIT